MRSLEDFDTEDVHAEWLDVDPVTLRRWRKKPNGLPYTTAGRTILYKRPWTLEWLESRRQQNNPELQPRPRRRGRPRRTERQLELAQERT